MLFWIYFASICVLFYLVEFVEPPWLVSISRAMFIIFLIIITGFRYNIGIDYDSYVNNFYLIDWDYFKEPFHIYLIEVLRFLNFDYQMLFLVYAILTYVILFKAIKRYNLNSVFSVVIYIFIFFWFAPASGMRQGLAAIIFLWGAPYIATREFKKYILVIFCATMVHYSAFVIGICYFFAHKHYPKWMHLSIVFIAVVCEILDIMPKIMVFVLPFTEIYLRYTDYVSHEASIGLVYVMRTLLWMVIILSISYGRNNYGNIIYNMYTLGTALRLVFAFSVDFARIAHYFEIFTILAIPLYLSAVRWQLGRIILRGIIIVSLLLVFINVVYKIPNNEYFLLKTSPSAGNIDYKFNFKFFK